MDVLLSVVVPARNSAVWIGELLESVLAQEVPDCEVIVVDNGSSDETVAVAESLDAGRGLVRVVPSDALNAGAARNEGVAAARGRFLVFADADDVVPDGAYRAMLAALRSSGSDMAIGNHLKFSPTRTWSPTARWYGFEEDRWRVAPEDVPELLTGRACWNRMFRRTFWNGAGLQFPEISSVEDIEPMTRSLLAARSIDVLARCVYLYRDRADGGSISRRSDSAATLRYLEQELRCAVLVRGLETWRTQHTDLVLDADGWVHLQRFLMSQPCSDDVEQVATALQELLPMLQTDRLERAAPIRRALWLLVMIGDWTEAARFVRDTSGPSAEDHLRAWTRAVQVVRAQDPAAANKLMSEGLVPAFVNGAEGVGVPEMSRVLPGLRGLSADGDEAGVLGAMTGAIRAGNAEAVVAVSALRAHVPLIVDQAEVSSEGVVLAGPLKPGIEGFRLSIDLGVPGYEALDIVLDPLGSRWKAVIEAGGLSEGRHVPWVRAAGIEGCFPLVTARMPLPPVAPEHPVQPLADRNDGWRFLLDRRVRERRPIRRFLRTLRRGAQ